MTAFQSAVSATDFACSRLQLGGDGVEPLLRGALAFLLKRRLLDLQLDDGAVGFIQFRRLAVGLDPKMACRLVHHVDRLVGKEALRDIAVGQLRRRDQGFVGDPHAMVKLVFLLQPAKHENRVLHRRLVDKDRLEAPRQRRVLFDILAIFVQRRRPDAAQLATRQRRFQKVGGIHRTVTLAGADKLVHLVDEQHHLAVA